MSKNKQKKKRTTKSNTAPLNPVIQGKYAGAKPESIVLIKGSNIYRPQTETVQSNAIAENQPASPVNSMEEPSPKEGHYMVELARVQFQKHLIKQRIFNIIRPIAIILIPILYFYFLNLICTRHNLPDVVSVLGIAFGIYFVAYFLFNRIKSIKSGNSYKYISNDLKMAAEGILKYKFTNVLIDNHQSGDIRECDRFIDDGDVHTVIYSFRGIMPADNCRHIRIVFDVKGKRFGLPFSFCDFELQYRITGKYGETTHFEHYSSAQMFTFYLAREAKRNVIIWLDNYTDSIHNQFNTLKSLGFSELQLVSVFDALSEQLKCDFGFLISESYLFLYVSSEKNRMDYELSASGTDRFDQFIEQQTRNADWMAAVVDIMARLKGHGLA